MKALLLFSAVCVALTSSSEFYQESPRSPCGVFCVKEASYDRRPGFTIEKIYGTSQTMWVGPDAVFGPELIREAEFVLAPSGSPGVLLYLTDAGRESFNEYAEVHHVQSIAIFVAGKLLLAPVIMGPAADEKLLVEGSITESEAKEFVSQLNSAKREGA